MQLELSKNGFLLLKDTKTGYINYSVIFKAAECDIMKLFNSMEYFAWDVFGEGDPKPLKYHIAQGNVKVIKGDLYFKNPDTFEEEGVIFADTLIPHIVIELGIAQQRMLSTFTNGRPMIIALAEDEEGLKDSIKNQEYTDKQKEKLERWHDAIKKFNVKVMNVIIHNYDKYGDDLQFP